MARHVQVSLEDDIDGGPAVGTMSFALDGITYEIDLNSENNAALRDALEPYVQHGRRVGRLGTRSAARSAASRGTEARTTATPVATTTRTASPRTAEGRAHNDAVRAWAKANGITISDRGRIPASVLDRYESRSDG